MIPKGPPHLSPLCLGLSISQSQLCRKISKGQYIVTGYGGLPARDNSQRRRQAHSGSQGLGARPRPHSPTTSGRHRARRRSSEHTGHRCPGHLISQSFPQSLLRAGHCRANGVQRALCLYQSRRGVPGSNSTRVRPRRSRLPGPHSDVQPWNRTLPLHSY